MGKPINFRSDSVLGSLPEERQEQIAEWIMECAEGDRYEFARTQLAADGVKVSRTAVASWYRGWALRQQLSSASSYALRAVKELKKQDPKFTEEQLTEVGQLIFTDRALQTGDPEEFRQMKYLKLAEDSARTRARLEEEKLKLRREAGKLAKDKLRFEIDKHLDDLSGKLLSGALRKRADEINAQNISQADKIAAMRKAAFADVDAYLATGKLVLPE